MKINKKGKEPIVTREIYKAVKKYDRRQFDTFCTELYQQGYNDGAAAGVECMAGLNVEKVLDAIAKTKGIGPKKLADIQASIVAAFGGEKDA